MNNLILIFIGGGLGSVARFLISKWFPQGTGTFPYPTLSANMAGCFLIGIVMGIAVKAGWIDKPTTLFLTVGFCGGLTTFSSFAIENLDLVNQNMFFQSVLYITLSLVLGILLTFIGFYIGKLPLN